MEQKFNKRHNLNKIRWCLFTKRRSLAYHNYHKIPKQKVYYHHTHRHHNKHKHYYVAVQVELPWENKDYVSYQLPKDLQKGALSLVDWDNKTDTLHKLADYFLDAIIVVPTKAYPHPHLVLGRIEGIALERESSLKRTRSQFLQWNNFNLKHIKFLLHDYDRKTKWRLLKQFFCYQSIYHIDLKIGIRTTYGYFNGENNFWNK